MSGSLCRNRPFGLLVLLGVGIGAAEILVMLLLPAGSSLSRGTLIALDAAILISVCLPLLYCLSYRPLREQLALLSAARDRAVEGEARLAEAQRIARLGTWEIDVESGRISWSEETFRHFGRDPALGAPAFEEFLAAVHAEDRERVRASIAAALAQETSPWECDYRVVQPDGDVRFLHEEARTLRDARGRIVRRVGTVQDVTDQTRARESARKEGELMRTLVALHESAERLELQEMVEAALGEMLRLTRSEVGSFFLCDEDAGRLTLLARSHAARVECPPPDPPASCELAQAGLWGEAVRRRRGVIADDLAVAVPGESALAEGHPRLARHMCIPVLFDGRVVAVAGVGNKRAPYDAQDESQLTLFARGLWEIVHRKRRDEEALEHRRSLRWLVRRLAVVEEEERRRIAVELHDTIVQDLAAARLMVAAVRADEEQEQRRAALGEVAATLDGVIGSTRALMYELHSPLLHEFGIEAALSGLAEQADKRHGIETRCDCAVPPTLSSDQGLLLYRIAQELLRNVVKHAGARRVTVRLGPDGGGARLVVEDDGRGFAASSPRSGAIQEGGFGLFSIREQLRELGGEIHIETGAGRGTRVVVTIPRAAQEDLVCR